MALDAIELLAHVLDRHVRIEQMALLVRPARAAEPIVVVEGLDVVVGIGAEEQSVHVCVGGGLTRPGVPH